MTTYFISDLHLHHNKPAITELFLSFIHQKACYADQLYILGDFFDAWIGDDYENEFISTIKHTLKKLSKQIPVYFLPGNRDFLVGKRLMQETGMRLLQDPCVIELYNKKILLAHGDIFCSNDRAYQIFKLVVQNPVIKKLFTCLPLNLRLGIAGRLRKNSSRQVGKQQINNKHGSLAQQNTQQNTGDNHAQHKLQVEPATVAKYLNQHPAEIIIHGHTHTPGEHLNSTTNTMRFVLGDWHPASAVILEMTDHNIQLLNYSSS